MRNEACVMHVARRVKLVIVLVAFLLLSGSECYADVQSFQNAGMRVVSENSLNLPAAFELTTDLGVSLPVDSNTIFNGSGIINSHEFCLSLIGGNSTVSSAITWTGGGVLKIAGKMALEATWIFEKDIEIVGDFSAFEFKPGSSFVIKPGVTVKISGLVLEGLGAQGGSIIFEDSTSMLRTSDVTIRMHGAYAMPTGCLYIEGPTEIVTNGFSWSAEGGAQIIAASQLTYVMPSQTEYRSLSMLMPDSDHLSLQGNGSVGVLTRATITDSAVTEDSVTAAASAPVTTSAVSSSGGLLFDAATGLVASNYDLNATYSVFFRGASSSSIVVDGQGLFLQMARTSLPLLMVNDNKSVRLNNIVLKDFSPAHIRLGRSSTLTFGDNVYIQLAENATPLTYSWHFDGMNCVLDGRGKVLQIRANDSLLLHDAKQLCLKDIRLIGAGSSATTSRLRCMGARSQLTFDDVTLYLDPVFNIKQGNLLIKNQVLIKGRGNMLAWTSTGTLTIDSNACLSFDYGTTFSYDSASGLRTQLIMTDFSSVLRLNNASLCATHTGLILSGGSVYFDNFVTVSSEASNEAESIVFDSGLKAYMPLGATVDIRGRVVYQ